MALNAIGTNYKPTTTKVRLCKKCQKHAVMKGRKICPICVFTLQKEKRQIALSKKKSRDLIKKQKKKEKKENSTKYLDGMWSKATKLFYGGKCEVCGKTDQLNSHHLFSRSNLAVRHDYRNCAVVCVYHHLWDTKISGHKAPAELLEFLKAKRGMKWYNDLLVRARQQKVDKNIFKKELQEIIKYANNLSQVTLVKDNPN